MSQPHGVLFTANSDLYGVRKHVHSAMRFLRRQSRKGKPESLEADEPARVAEAAERLGLKHVVITSVTRDDLPDGGAEHFYQCVIAVRERTGAAVEVLTPTQKPSRDFIVACVDPNRIIAGRWVCSNESRKSTRRSKPKAV